MRRSAILSTRFDLRVAAVVFIFAGLVMLSGCWVYSVNPLYEDNASKPDPDLAFDPNLVGSWWAADEDCPWIITITAERQVYELALAPSPQCKSKEKTSNYEGHLVKLDNHIFLDIAPKENEVCASCLALRQFFLVQADKNSLALTPINFEWLKKSIEQNTVMLATLPSRPEVLTAPSKELKDFMRKYADDKSAFQADASLTFKRK